MLNGWENIDIAYAYKKFVKENHYFYIITKLLRILGYQLPLPKGLALRVLGDPGCLAAPT